MKILKIKIKDLKFLYNLYNYNILKKLFSSKKKIKYSQHVKWFKQNCIENKKIHIFIVKNENLKIGYVRFKNIKKNIFEVSLALRHNYQDKGIGTKMLEKAIKKFLPKKKIIVISKIKKINKKSISCFKKNKFNEINFSKKLFYYLKNHNEYNFYKYSRSKVK